MPRYLATIYAPPGVGDQLTDAVIYVAGTADEAWEYLAQCRANDEQEHEAFGGAFSHTWEQLRERAKTSAVLIGEDGSGVVNGPTPGATDELDDQGLSYMVAVISHVD